MIATIGYLILGVCAFALTGFLIVCCALRSAYHNAPYEHESDFDGRNDKNGGVK